MKKLYLTIFMFIMMTALLANPLLENFDADAVPAGWTIDGTSADGWITSNAIIGDHTGNGGYYFMFNCYNEQVGLTGLATTPRVTVSAEESNLDFWVNYFLLEGDWGNSANLYVDISTDEGATWVMGTTDFIENEFGTGWHNITINLAEYIGQNINVRFNAISDYGAYNIAVDDVSGPSIYATQEIPGVAIDPIPANATTEAAIVQTLEWSAGSGTPLGYKMYFGTTVEPEFIEDIGNNSFYQIPNVLEYSTTYYWKVVPYNAIGDAESSPIWQFTTLTSDAIETFPWTEDFAEADLSSNWPLPGWNRAEGELAEPTTMAWDAFGWSADDFANIEEPVNISARINIYGTGRIHWLVTPSFNLAPGQDYVLSMDMALTQYGNNDPGTLGEDDFFAVVISPDNGYTWSSNHVLKQWIAGDEIINAAQNEEVTISGYSGLVRIGFYGQSLVANEDVDLFIDNLNISLDGMFIEGEELNDMAAYSLIGNYPNPFNPSTTINFSIPTESKVNITVYNIKGQTVKTLTSEKYGRGNHQVIWNGKDLSNNSVTSGVYFYKLSVDGKEKDIKKMLLLK